jgi:toxin ParE1/3/4
VGLRLWRIKRFEKLFIFYRATEDGVEVVRVLHGHRVTEAGFDDGTCGEALEVRI